MPIARSLFTSLLLVGLLLPYAAQATGLVNINTADETTLEGLPHIGTATAQKIIDYRTQNGPFGSITDLQKVSGIGSGSNYADIAPLITVGDTSTDADTSTNDSESTTTDAEDTPDTSVHSSGALHAPPPALTIDIGSDRQATVHTPVAFTAAVATPTGGADTYAQVSWAFGDGASSGGYASEAVYDEPGTYLVAAKATDGPAAAYAKITVTVTTASVQIISVADTGIRIKNDGAADLDLSGWVLVEGSTNFRIPEGTWVAPGATVLFPVRATKLAASDTAVLAYPDGSIAAVYPVATAQPITLTAGYRQVQTVEPALTSLTTEDHAATPPAGEDPGEAAAGASDASAAVASSLAAGGLLHSPWTLGALAAVVVAGGVLLIL